MGSLYSTDASDLMGLFILYKLSAYHGIDIDRTGLHRSVGLMIVEDSTKIKVNRENDPERI